VFEPRIRSVRHTKRFVAWFGPSRTLRHEGQTINLSEKGLALRAPDLYGIGTVLRIAVKPLDQPAFDLEGVVVWVNDPSNGLGGQAGMMGVRLTAIDPRFTAFVARVNDASARRTAAPAPGAGSTPPPRWAPMATPATPISSSAPTVMAPAPMPAAPQGYAPTPSGYGFGAVPQQQYSPPAWTTPAPQSVAPPATRPPAPPPAPIAPPPAPAKPPLAAASIDSFYSVGMPNNAPNTMASISVSVSTAGLPPSTGSTWPPGATRIDGLNSDPRKVRMPRFDEVLPLHWGPTGLSNRGYTVNLSRSGLAITVRDPVAPGARLLMAITLPEGQTAKASGIAVWQRMGNAGYSSIGIRLLHADERYLKLIETLARRRSA
jgi:hypothetical protein